VTEREILCKDDAAHLRCRYTASYTAAVDNDARRLLEDDRVVKAAGGLVWRAGRKGPRLAVVHRPRQDDWRLPKGKLKPGEDFTEAAAREVAEETGCRPRLVEFAGYALYARNRRPKVALFWHMTADGESCFEPNDEIDRVKWLTPEDALGRIEHPAERRLLRSVRMAEVARHL
jgi:8-oxo-dGTP pyrophosphatase MutT (NUDIX family)